MRVLQFYRRLSALWTPFTRERPSLYAAGAGFYLLLSVFPTAVFLLGLLPRLPAAAEAATDFLLSVIPEGFAPLVKAVERELTVKSGTAVLSLSALTSLWSASKGILALSDGFRAVLDAPQDSRGFVRRRLSSALQLSILLLCLSAVTLLPVPGGSLLPLWFGFCLLYSVLPGIRLPLPFRIVGSGAAALGWLLFSRLFSLYLDHSAGLRGGLGFLVMALIWLHSCIQLLLYGAILARLLAEDAWHPLQIVRNALFPPCS